VLVMAFVMLGFPVGGVSLGPNSMIAGSLLLLVGYQVSSLGVFAVVAGDPIQEPSGPIATWITESLSLERAATAGLFVFAIGAGSALSLIWTWVNAGYGGVPFTNYSILSFTAIVLGLQTIFSAFFLSMVD